MKKAAVSCLFCRRFESGLGRLAHRTVLLIELLDAASRINDLLFAGVERMAGSAHFDMQRLLHRRSGREGVAAGAGHRDFVVCRMDVGFHLVLFLYVGPVGRAQGGKDRHTRQ